MLCEKCRLKEATYHSTVNMNGNVTATHLCSECAITENKLNNVFGVTNFFNPTFFGLNDDFFAQKPKAKKESVCETCGKTFAEFLNTGFFGCAECYKAFETELEPILKQMQPSTKHIGKTVEAVTFADDKEKNLKNLEFKLKQAVANENYELASELKKKINELKNGGVANDK